MKLGLKQEIRTRYDNRLDVYIIDNNGTCLIRKTFATLNGAEKFAAKFIARQIYANGGEA